ncbi:MAG: hypothetical protein GX683_05525, partial [Ruminococcaceae bacterium]|nr:hypothetical protein [Oscillospiraceae bacterium]
MSVFSDCEQGKFSKRVFDIFTFCFFALFFALFISQCFFNNSTENFNTAIQIASSACVTVVLVVLYFFYEKRVKAKLEVLTLPKWLIPTLLGVLFVALQVVYVGMTHTQIGFDCRVVAAASHAPDPTYETEYFSKYPHVFSLFFIFRTYYSLLDIFVGAYEHWFVIDLLNIVAVDVSIVFAYKVAKLLFSKRIAKLTVIMSVLLFGLFPYLIVPYTDIFSMPFTVLSMYFFLKMLSEG